MSVMKRMKGGPSCEMKLVDYFLLAREGLVVEIKVSLRDFDSTVLEIYLEGWGKIVSRV